MVETIGDYEVIYKISSERLQEFEEQKELIDELKNKQNNLKKEIII